MTKPNMTTKRSRRPDTVKRGTKVHARRTVSAAEAAEERFRRLEQKARDDEARRADLLSLAAHDLRNPLGVVLVTTTMLAKEVTGSHQGEQLAAIRRAATEMTHVIEDLVDSASIDTGGLQLLCDEWDTLELMQEAVTTARAAASERSVTVDARIDHDLPWLYVDRHRVLQAISRIVANALRFMPKNGSITIGAKREADAVKFFVADSGPAVPDSQRPFAFLRRPPPGRRTCRGTGLGMFVVKGIVEAHGGRVELTSETDRGNGNTVSFVLPIKRADEDLGV